MLEGILANPTTAGNNELLIALRDAMRLKKQLGQRWTTVLRSWQHSQNLCDGLILIGCDFTAHVCCSKLVLS